MYILFKWLHLATKHSGISAQSCNETFVYRDCYVNEKTVYISCHVGKQFTYFLLKAAGNDKHGGMDSVGHCINGY